MSIRQHQTLALTTPADSIERAATYVRMSHESQVYSPVNQMSLIKQYAIEHNLTIVRTFSDEGISGLRIENRPGLKALLTEIVHGRADFSKLLVYDVSRWGRFQDIDESAHYEFICRRQGVNVIYCAELFGSDNSLISTIGKVLKRGAAAEYSRELSVKTFRASCHLASRGFALGGTATYGLKKVLIDEEGKRIRKPLPSDRKTHRGYRLSLMPGPIKEVRVVREIFRRYVELQETMPQIAAFLNDNGFRTRRGCKWSAEGIFRTLPEEKYIGTQVYNRISQKMQEPRQRNPRSQWVRKINAFPGIVDPELFHRAQQRLEKRKSRRADEDLLELLRKLLARHGYLTATLIEQKKTMPAVQTYSNHFGSLLNAYKLIGYEYDLHAPCSRQRLLRRALRGELIEEVRGVVESTGVGLAYDGMSTWFTIGDALDCSLQLIKPRPSQRGPRWYRVNPIRLATRARAAAFHLIVRLSVDGHTAKDCFVISSRSYYAFPNVIGTRNSSDVDHKRFPTFRDAILSVLARMKESRRWMNHASQ